MGNRIATAHLTPTYNGSISAVASQLFDDEDAAAAGSDTRAVLLCRPCCCFCPDPGGMVILVRNRSIGCITTCVRCLLWWWWWWLVLVLCAGCCCFSVVRYCTYIRFSSNQTSTVVTYVIFRRPTIRTYVLYAMCPHVHLSSDVPHGQSWDYRMYYTKLEEHTYLMPSKHNMKTSDSPLSS
jgi:hypothetical protein